MRRIIVVTLLCFMAFPITAGAACVVENDVVVGYEQEAIGTEIEIPSGVQVIGKGAFNSVRSIYSIYIPTTVTSAEDPNNIFFFPPQVIYGHSGTYAETLAMQFQPLTVFRTLGAGTSSLDHFVPRVSYDSTAFDDIDENSWYGTNHQGVVKAAIELGLMEGEGDGRFAPDDPLLLCEAITIACRVHNIYHGGNGELKQLCEWSGAVVDENSQWYEPYLAYANDYGIFQSFYMDTSTENCQRPATRAEVAYLLARALPGEELPARHEAEALSDVDLPWWEGGPEHGDDSPAYYYYIPYIYELYRAGVITGYEDKSFAPQQNITRAETAAMLSRLIEESTRG